MDYSNHDDAELRQIEDDVRHRCREAFKVANSLHVEWGEVATEINRRKVARTTPNPLASVSSMSKEDLIKLIGLIQSAS